MFYSPRTPDDSPVDSLEAKQLNPDSISENTQMTSVPDRPPGISNDDFADMGDEGAAKFLKEASRSLESEQPTPTADTPLTP